MKKTDKKYIKLRDKWQKILEKDGFNDIEKYYPGKMQPHSPPLADTTYRKAKALYDDPQKQAYFKLAGNFLYSGWFSEQPDKLYELWEKHCEGWKISEIVRLKLKKQSRRIDNTKEYKELSKLLNDLQQHFIDWIKSNDNQETD